MFALRRKESKAMSCKMRLIFTPEKVELDENQNVREVADNKKVADEMLKVCKDRVSVSPARSELSDNSHGSSMHPSESESEKETSRSSTPEPLPSTRSTSESESLTSETEENVITVEPKKAEKEKKITILRRPQAELERLQSVSPPSKVPQQTVLERLQSTSVPPKAASQTVSERLLPTCPPPKEPRQTVVERFQRHLPPRFQRSRLPCPPPQMPPQTDIQSIWPTQQQQSPWSTKVQPLLKSPIEVQPFRSIQPQQPLHPRAELQPIQPTLLNPRSQPPTESQPHLPMIPQWLWIKQREIKLLQKVFTQIRLQHQSLLSSSKPQFAEKAKSEAEPKNQIEYEGRNILNLVENLRPCSWQLQAPIHKPEILLASKTNTDDCQNEGDSSNTKFSLVVGGGKK